MSQEMRRRLAARENIAAVTESDVPELLRIRRFSEGLEHGGDRRRSSGWGGSATAPSGCRPTPRPSERSARSAADRSGCPMTRPAAATATVTWRPANRPFELHP